MQVISSSKMFETENCLVASSIDHCKTLTTKTDCIEKITVVLKEVNIGFGIADIVVVEYNDNRISDAGFYLNKNDIAVYKFVEKHEHVHTELIVENTRLSKPQVYKSILKLNKLNYISQENSGEVNLLNKYSSGIVNSVAIEAKLKNWKRALNQAYRYKWFATKCYVLLDKANLRPAKKNIDQFQKLGVGLLSLGTCGSMDTIYDPGCEDPIDQRMAILLNELVAEQLFNNSISSIDS